MIGDNKGKFKKYETNNNLYSLQILNFLMIDHIFIIQNILLFLLIEFW